MINSSTLGVPCYTYSIVRAPKPYSKYEGAYIKGLRDYLYYFGGIMV